MKKEFEKIIKSVIAFFIIGREEFPYLDKLIFRLSKGMSSGWVLANKIRAFFYGRKKSVSHEPLIFIGGFPRSGTSLLRAVLEQHKDIASPGIEIFPFEELHDKWRLKKGFKLTDKEIKRLEKYKHDLILYTDKVSKLFKKKQKAKKVMFKHPKYVMFIKDTFKYFPNSKIIHIMRDGKNATMSQRFWLLPPWRKEWNYAWCCRQWIMYLNRGKEFKDDKRYLEIKYEDLIENPKKTTDKIFKFMDLKPLTKKKLENFYKRKNVDKHKDHPGLSKPLDKKRTTKWLSKMSEKDKKTFEKIAGKMYKEKGYPYQK